MSISSKKRARGDYYDDMENDDLSSGASDVSSDSVHGNLVANLTDAKHNDLSGQTTFHKQRSKILEAQIAAQDDSHDLASSGAQDDLHDAARPGQLVGTSISERLAKLSHILETKCGRSKLKSSSRSHSSPSKAISAFLSINSQQSSRTPPTNQMQSGVKLRFKTGSRSSSNSRKSDALHGVPRDLSQEFRADILSPTVLNKLPSSHFKEQVSSMDGCIAYFVQKIESMLASEAGPIKQSKGLQNFVSLYEPTQPEIDKLRQVLLGLSENVHQKPIGSLKAVQDTIKSTFAGYRHSVFLEFIVSQIIRGTENETAVGTIAALKNFLMSMELYSASAEFEFEVSKSDGSLLDCSEKCIGSFRFICRKIPRSFLAAFHPFPIVAISVWTSLPFTSRVHLSSAILKVSIFDNLMEDFSSSGTISTLLDNCGNNIPRVPSVSDVTRLLKSFGSLFEACNIPEWLLAYQLLECNDEKLQSMQNRIVESCKETFLTERDVLKANSLLNSFDVDFLGLLTILEFRKTAYEKNQQGGQLLESMLKDSNGNPTETMDNAQKLIDGILQYIRKHNFPRGTWPLSTVISCKTRFLSEITLRLLISLRIGEWISTGCIDFALELHALSTGACSYEFSDPLEYGPKVLYADSMFYSSFLLSRRKWKYGLEWQWLLAPILVDWNHYILLAISFVHNIIVTCDSLGFDRSSEQDKAAAWVRFLGIDTTLWTIKSLICPQQTNGYDCGIMTILAAVYLPLCEPLLICSNSHCLDKYYSQHHADSVRAWLIFSIYKHGEERRLPVSKWNLH